MIQQLVNTLKTNSVLFGSRTQLVRALIKMFTKSTIVRLRDKEQKAYNNV